MDKLFDYQGNKIAIGGGMNRSFIRGIAHRGYNYTTAYNGATYFVNNEDGAPENTLPAYRLAAEKGFKFAETDVAFTSDGVPVCLHDDTIDRTSNGTGAIANMTLQQVKAYSFNYNNVGGTHVIEGFENVTIPTFEEFIQCCRDLGIHPYIEMKYTYNYTEAQVRQIVDIVNDNAMNGNVSYISFNSALLTYVKNYNSKARLGLLVADTSGSFYPLNATAVATAKSLITSENDVFISARAFSSTAVNLCSSEGIPLETWGMTMNSNDTETIILSLDHYISGVTSDKYDASVLFYNNEVGA